MPKLANPRWEELARLKATALPHADAYFGAGFQVLSKTGSERREVAGKRCSKLLASHPEIRARIVELETELRDSTLKKAEISRDWVLNGLKDNYERAMQLTPVKNREGEETGEYVYNGAVANRALELSGKEVGMFADRTLIGTLDGEIEGMSVEQIRNFIRTACNEVGLRMVDMNDAQTREWILANAPKVGLTVTATSGDGAAGGEAPKDRKLPALH